MEAPGQRSGTKRKWAESLFELMRGQIDLTRDPFSGRGSRLIVQQTAGESSLFVRLGERLIELDADPEAHVMRPPFLQNLQLVDADGDALHFEAEASPDVIRLRTRLGEFGLVFLDEQTLAFGLPPNAEAGLRFDLNAALFRRIEADGLSNQIRRLACATNGEMLSEVITPEPFGARLEYRARGADCALALRIGESPAFTEEVPPFSQIREQAATAWKKWFEHAPPVDERYAEKYAYAWWVMANNLVSPRGHIAYESAAPSKALYIGLWLWDNAFHAIAFRHADAELARNQVRVALKYQQPDGMLPDVVFDEGVLVELDHPVHGKVTKPPILAWAAWKVHEMHPSLDFLREVYEPLTRENAWWFELNDDDRDGLAQYNHPYSSGLDDSPLWDHGLPVEAPDLNTYLFIQMESLARMAEALDLKPDAAMWKRKTDALARRMLEDLWDEETGFFRALHNEKPIPVRTPFNLLPLWTGSLPPRVTARVLEHLANPREFSGETMLPTVARDDPACDPDKMWRGPAWANINYFFIEAFQRIGRTDLARRLRGKTLNMIMSQPSIYEYYNSETGRPGGRAVPAFGWSAAVFIDLAIQASADPSERGL